MGAKVPSKREKKKPKKQKTQASKAQHQGENRFQILTKQ